MARKAADELMQLRLDRSAARDGWGWRDSLHYLYQSSAWLTVTGCLMLVDLVISGIGLVVDPSSVGGAPTWLKPLKFAISTSVFSFTLAFMIGQLRRTRRFAAIVGGFVGAALTLEIVLIDGQAARHVASHFNVGRPLDKMVFATMGAGIAVVLAGTVLLFLATCFERFADRSLGWVFRLGLALALAGMGTGVLMTLPTPQQLAAAQEGKGMPRSGAHTVGAPDGGPAMAVTGWSADHGDLRIAHFVGLHGMQVLLLGWWMSWGWKLLRRSRLIWALAVSVAGVYGTVLWQALRGLPLLRPDGAIVAGWVAWLIGSGILIVWALDSKRNRGCCCPKLAAGGDAMITADGVFRLCGTLAMLGWLCLLLTPLWPRRFRERLPRLIGGLAIPGVIAAVYTGVIVTHWAGHRGGFNSLDEVMLLFTDRWLVTAGWVHYLAFDLFVGGWQIEDSRRRGIGHVWMVPILLLTFFFGPMGLLLYLGVRGLLGKRAIAVAD